MSGVKLVSVRVLPQRSLSIGDGRGGSIHYVAGDVLELSAEEAKALRKQGFVEKA